jgi:hypothetical protein
MSYFNCKCKDVTDDWCYLYYNETKLILFFKVLRLYLKSKQEILNTWFLYLTNEKKFAWWQLMKDIIMYSLYYNYNWADADHVEGVINYTFVQLNDNRIISQVE